LCWWLRSLFISRGLFFFICKKKVRNQKNALIKNSQNAHWLGEKKSMKKICYNSPDTSWLATSEPTKPGGLGGCVGGGSIHTAEILQWNY
jgi:hypothetical protein